MKQPVTSNHYSTWGIVIIGVGSMVGAGVFALLGVAATKAGSAVWLSFLVAGLIALLTGHSFSQLGVRFPSRGGIVDYLEQSFGVNLLSAGCSVLFYIAQLIGVSMISLAFGKFLAMLLGIEQGLGIWERAFATGLILAICAMFLYGSRFIGKIHRVFVLINLLILAGFTVALIPHIKLSYLSPGTWPELTHITGSLALTFFAFTGFSVICNSTELMENPSKELPRAMFLAIGLVTLLYVALALAVAGVVASKELTGSGAALLAVAARSILGDIGYNILLVSAIVSSMTCLAGGLFGVTNITYAMAQRGQLPSEFQKSIRSTTGGLIISAVLACLLANFFSLATVASLGSATSLLVYTLVNIGAFRIVSDWGKDRILILASIVACLFAILVWVVYTYRNEPHAFGVFLVFTILAFISQVLVRRKN